MNHADALKLAKDARQVLQPFCARICIAGSIRRQRPQVKDIELVCLPRQEPADLFGTELVACADFCAAVNQWAKDIGEPTGKYTRRFLPRGIKLDLFIADADNWGWQLCLRTGGKDFNQAVLLPALKRQGYTLKYGDLYRHGVLAPMREESEVFVAAGLPFVGPTAREVEAWNDGREREDSTPRRERDDAYPV